jgi:S-adenosylmethionine hydrolase
MKFSFYSIIHLYKSVLNASENYMLKDSLKIQKKKDLYQNKGNATFHDFDMYAKSMSSCAFRSEKQAYEFNNRFFTLQFSQEMKSTDKIPVSKFYRIIN